MIKKSDVKDMYSLSPMQEGMLFHYLMDKQSPAYFEQTSYRIDGQLNYPLFKKAFNRLIERYDVLRTIFVYEKMQRMLQVVLKRRDASVYYEDISHLNGERREQWVKDFKIKDKIRGFELEKGPLIRLAILKLADEKYEIIWSFHHIIMDGWCVSILVKEMLLSYYSLKRGETVTLPPTAQYGNYIKWLEEQDKETGINYWERYLEFYENQAVIPRSTEESTKKYEQKIHRFKIDRALTEKLIKISNESSVTMSTIIQALWGILLQKYNDTDDVVFGAIVSGRPANLENIEKMVGLFINAVPIRIKAETGDTFVQLIKKVQSQSVQSRSYEFVPLAEIQSHSLLKRELIDQLFIFENYPVDREIKRSSGEHTSSFSVENVDIVEQTTYDLNVMVSFVRELVIKIAYNASVYDPPVIERIEVHLGQIAEQVIAGDIPLEEIEVISPPEKNRILYEFNNNKTPLPGAQAYELFERHEAAAPGRTAVIHEDSHLSYGQVNRDVNRRACLFKKYGIGQNLIVALLLERSPRLFEIIMALWKVGAAYIPMETDYPPQRINEILNSSGTGFLITRSEYVPPEIEESFPGRIIKLDEEKEAIANESGANPDLETDIHGLAYILYTSGSTGKPKGAMVEHIGSMNHMHGKIADTEMDSHSIMVQNGPQTFDISIWQFFAPLILGSRTIMYTHSLILEPDRFIDRLIRDQVTVLEVVPSYLTVLLDYLERRALESLPLKYLLPTGEELKAPLVKKWFTLFPGIKMINTYGPTEASDDVAHYIMDKVPEGAIPIGKPLSNLNMYIVDRHMKLCPVGIKGEVCVSGIGVGRGYLKDEARTKLVFMEDPFVEEKGVRLYKMGDLGCFLPDGNMLFFGRKDYQVKIRGHLIECGEIENRLLGIPHIKEAVVIDREDIKGHKYLSAYLVSDTDLDIPQVRDRLAAHLPAYMIPAYFMQIDELPLTPNGKINRRALPEPRETIGESADYIAPRDEVEKVLAEIWEELLAVPNPGINDNFFDSGGHSLNGMTFISSIHKRLDVEIPIRELFDRPTIREISEYIKNTGETVYTSIQAVEKRDYYTLSSAQSRLVVLDNIAEKSTAYNLYTMLELSGGLDKERLEKAFKGLIERHESLRTAFLIIDGNPVQVIREQVDFQVEYYNESRIVEGEAAIKSIVQDSFIRPFDLSRAPLIRTGLIKTGEMRHLIMVDIHHIVCDGAAFDTIVKDISGLYGGESLPELRVQYKDYALRQSEKKGTEEFREKETYWLDKLTGEIPVLSLSTDYSRPPVQNFAGSNFKFTIEKELSEKIKTLSGDQGATLYMTMLTAYYALLFRYTGQEDIIVGTPTAGRQHADLEDILGMFVNILTMRNYPSGEKTFSGLLREVKENALNAYQNQDYQFEELVANLDLSRDLSRNPLFDTLFAVQNMEIREMRLPDLQIKRYSLEERTAKFDITLYAYETGDEILLEFNYCTKLFKSHTIERLCRRYIKVLEEVVGSPQLKLHEIRVLSKAEKEQLLVEFNDTGSDYPRDETIAGLFERQVEKNPGHIALTGPPQTKNRAHKSHMTYQELNREAGRLAHLLIEKGVKPGSIVGIMVERSFEMITGIFGIMKAGGAYLPIDPEYPQERVDFMLKDSGAQLLLTIDDLASWPTTWAGDESQERRGEPRVPPLLRVAPGEPAYVIYTSGTTGKPKGTIIEHRSLVNRLNWMQKKYPIDENDTILQKTTYTFDVSVWEIFWWSIVGAKCCLLLPGGEGDPAAIVDAIETNNITVMHFVPSMLNAFLEYIESSTDIKRLVPLKQVIASGEALLPTHVERFNRLLNKENGAKLANLYGPTEATIDVSYFDCSDGGDKKIIPIGKPIDNICLVILDKHLHIQPLGVSGELCIAGVGLARGYLNRPELTADKFLNNKSFLGVQGAIFQKSPLAAGGIFYKTGDLARWLPDGNIEYLGRIDHQVKIRGFRIEPDEIKNRLLKHEDITGAVVIAKEGKDSDKFLTAYIVSDREPPVLQLKEFLSRELPDYMVPSYFVQIPSMPLTANGKVDRRKLPEPGLSGGEEYAAPGDRIEEALLETWEEVLESEKIGVNDNFFNIGGDSIKAIRLTSSINNRFQSAVKILDLFRHNTIRELALVVKKGKVVLPDKELEEAEKEIEELKARIIKSGKAPEDVEEIFPMSDIEKGMIFHAYRNPDESVYHDQFVYNPKYSNFEPEILRQALELMLEKHSILRTTFNVDDFNEFVHFIHKPFPPVYNHYDIRGLDRPAQQQYILKYMKEDRKDRWIITSAPLCRMATFQLGRDNICAVWTFHHAILDGWSNASLMTELNNTYFKLKDDKNYTPGDLKISYRDFIIHETAEKKRISNIDFWKKELEGYKRISFAGGVKNEPDEMHEFKAIPGSDINENLMNAAKHYNTGLKHICFAAYVYMLSMLTYENDVVAGLVSNNRPEIEDGDKLVGCFLNTLPFRMSIPAGITWSEYIHLVDSKLTRLKQYDKITFFEIVRAIGERNRAENPVYDTIFNYMDFHIYKDAAREDKSPDDEKGLIIAGYEKTNTLFDFNIKTYLGGISVGLRYYTSVLSDKTAEKLYGYFENILKLIISRPEGVINADEILSNEEKQRLLYEFNDTDTEYPKDKTIHQLFLDQVRIAPGRTAVIFEDKRLTYKGLDEKSGLLARLLQEKGISPGTVVGIMVERSIEMITGIFGIVKAGGAYLPIDPGYPQERIDFMLRDSGAKLLLTADELTAEPGVGAGAHHVGGDQAPARGPSAIGGQPQGLPLQAVPQSPVPLEGTYAACPATSLAYVIYTSGTTGKPKGTIIEHRSLVNRLNWMQKKYPIDENDTILQKTTYTFDVSVWEIFWWSIVGAKVCLLLPGGEKDPKIITRTVERNNVTTMHFVPSMLSVFLDYLSGSSEVKKLSALKQVIASGEALSSAQVERLNRLLNKENGTKLANLYGPTEAAIDVSYFDCSNGRKVDKIPIGKPIDNIRLFILSKQDRVQPQGIPGQLCIAGVGLARGYINRPELTSEKFPTHSFELDRSYRTHMSYNLYQTGDLARWLPDGNIEFLGRIDHQVKIRGFRIELDEINNRLLKHEHITGAAVIAKEGKNNDKFLAAYIVSDREPPVSELKEFLSRELPDYMVPSYFVQIPVIPLTANGKIDRRKLPEPVLTGGEEYAAPGNKIEEALVDIWKKILELERIGVNDNFFNIGGDSIKAIRLVSSMDNLLQTNVKISDLFTYNTIRKLAGVLKIGTVLLPDKEVEKAEKEVGELKTVIMKSNKIPGDVEDVFPMSDIEKGMIFHAHSNPDESIYHDQFVYNQEYSGFNPDIFRRALELMMEKHAVLRSSYNIDDFDEFVHFIHKSFPPTYKHHDIRALSKADQRKSIVKYMADDRKNRWDITSPPLCRMATFDLGRDNICAVWTFHHAILDGWSNASLITELNNTYFELKTDKHYMPVRLKISYKDFIIQEIAEKRKTENIDFWKKELDGYIRIPFPGTGKNEPEEIHDFAPPPDREMNEKLVDAAAHYKTSFRHMAFAAYVYMLSMLTYENDVVVGFISNNRPEKEDGDKLIGCFLNTLPFRIRIPGGITWQEYIGMVDGKLARLKQYDKITFFEIVKAIGKTDRAENPIFDTIFGYVDFHIFEEATLESNQSNDVREDVIPGYEKTNTLFDFGVIPLSQGIRVIFRYSTTIISDEMAEKLYGYFESIMKLMIARPRDRIKKDEIIPGEEKRRLLYEFNDTETAYPKDKTIHELFEEQADRNPDHIAVVDTGSGPGETVHTAYRLLNEKANRLAELVRTKGVKADTPVGLMMTPSIEMIAGILGILKAGGAYLPIDLKLPENRISAMLKDANTPLLLTKRNIIRDYSLLSSKKIEDVTQEPLLTEGRSQIRDLDNLPFLDRSLIDHEKYNEYIGLAAVKDSVCLQGTRGCPFKCIYCHKIWPKTHIVRSAENIFEEVRRLYDIGIKRFSFIDDIFNLNVKNSTRFFELIIKNNMKVQFFFPNGLRGELLTTDYIDLMIEAGTVNVSLSLETASPRLQKLIKKNLNIEKLRENVRYFCEKHPQVILDIQTMHGFPTETEEEALKTMDFLKSMHWIHFPYIHTVKIYQNTDMERFAIEQGISKDVIRGAAGQAYHQLSDTLAFDKDFTLRYRSEFLREYFLSKERLLHVLPRQVRILTEDEIAQKYSSYLNVPINSLEDLLEFAGISKNELKTGGGPDPDYMKVPRLNEKLKKLTPAVKPAEDALRILILDLSTFFSSEKDVFYNMIEPPLGPMYILSYLNRHLGNKIKGKIVKSRLDFDNYRELKDLLAEFKPDVIGVRTLTYYKDFFHKGIDVIRQYGIDVPIIAGGPYATSDFKTLLQDDNIDVVVMGEGEATFCELIEKIIGNNGKLPGEAVLEKIPGLAYIPGRIDRGRRSGREILFPDEMEGKHPGTYPGNPVPVNRPSNLAYVMYTSGSTGKPKGTMISHRNVIRVVKETNYIDIKENDRILQLSDYAFDGSVFDIYGALLNGAALVLVKKEGLFEMERLRYVLKNEEITVFFTTTALFNMLVELDMDCFKGIKRVLFGGERVSVEHTRKVFEYLGKGKVLHVYGPTESTVYASCHKLYEIGDAPDTIPIGKPLSNTNIYIVDKNLQPVPIGLYGEIVIGGAGIARGYQNTPELTEEKFHPNPYVKGDRLYKTGDMARWLPDGTIEFSGRKDFQVKLRGFRIELEDIEIQLLKHEDIKEAVVQVKESEGRYKYLCAYIIADKDPDLSELREHLLTDLPEYMIPAYFVKLEEFPLNNSGKIDRAALPEPEEIYIRGKKQYAAPGNEVEAKLADIWEQVLGRDKIGVDENFFEIGGDSIKTIQISARMAAAGYKVDMRDFFAMPTITGLSAHIKKIENVSDQSLITGPVPLTPVQQWFFEFDSPDSHHFNQAMMLHWEDGITGEEVEKMFRELQEHHDALRMIYKEENGEIEQENRGPDYPLSLKEYDWCEESGNDRKSVLKRMAEKVNEIQASIDLSKGPLMKSGLFHLDDGDRLLIVIHHLIIDGVSWRILFEDIDTLYRQYKRHENEKTAVLPLKTDSFKSWAGKLSQYADSDLFLSGEKPYWAKLEAESPGIPRIPVDFEIENSYVKDTRSLSFSLSEEQTGDLLTKVHESFGTEINDILLTALGLAIEKTWGHRKVLITLEGHGRQDIIPGIDISRTVGWFTAIYPVILNMSYRDDLSRQVKEIKESLHQLPHKGIGYGILRYLTSTKNKPHLEFELEPQVSFNYLGRFDEDVAKKSFTVIGQAAGRSISPEAKRVSDLDIVALTANRQLRVSISYNEKQFKPGTVETLLEHYKNRLTHIISFCRKQEKRELTPSDLTYKKLSIEELDRFTETYEYMVEDIYPLSPLQEGILFHYLYDKYSSAYLEQIAWRLHRYWDIPNVEKSLNELLTRHDILRTVFIGEQGERLLQVVLKEGKIDFSYEDISTRDDRNEYSTRVKKRNSGRAFDLSKEIAMRVSVLKIGKREYEFIWNVHHILMDGWCLGILISEFFEIYQSFIENRDYRLNPVKQYKTYIKWIENQDRNAAVDYWKRYLSGYESPAVIPQMNVQLKENREYKHGQFYFAVETDQANALKHLAAKNQVTLSTIMEAVWGILLGKYNSRNDVIFGIVVSVRPPEIEGIETMVGLLLNSVPFRITFTGDTTFNELLRNVQNEVVNMTPYQYLSLGEIQSLSPLQQDLVQSGLVFENYPVIDNVDSSGGEAGESETGNTEAATELSNVDFIDQAHNDFYIVISPGTRIGVLVRYNGNVFSSDVIEKIALHFNEIISRVIDNADSKIEDICLSQELLPAASTILQEDSGDFSI